MHPIPAEQAGDIQGIIQLLSIKNGMLLEGKLAKFFVGALVSLNKPNFHDKAVNHFKLSYLQKM